MKGKIKGKTAKVPSPFEPTVHKTEWTLAAKLAEWINQITKEQSIPLGKAEVETTIEANRKRGDIILFETLNSQKVLCVIEAKLPFDDVFALELVDDARKKANQRKAPYFGTLNFQKLILWQTQKANDPTLRLEEQIDDKFSLSELINPDEIEQARYSEPIKKGLANFLSELYQVHTGKKTKPRQAIDEILIACLHEKIRILAFHYNRIIEENCQKAPAFAKKLSGWFSEQGWDFNNQPRDYEKAARQTAYLLVDKILFYNLLQAKRPQELNSLSIPASLTKGALLQKTLQAYFDEVLKIDYESIYTTDFIDEIAFPDVEEVVAEIKELIKVFNLYNFSKLGYDVIGRIFERLIPQEERHNLGQYFTHPDVVDLILRFCLSHEEDKVLDPSCGAGTFLVRAYKHKQIMNQQLEHNKILATLWGNDIAKFPAHLATINLAINDLGAQENYPNIIQEDFFAFQIGEQGFELPEKHRKRRAVDLGKKKREIVYPRWFDAIVGNPPYTRQEEISEIGVNKEKLIENALKIGGEKIAEIGKRAGIHAYFFVHGSKFLKEGGHFGFIVSNSWLDVDYGKGLQEFFLKNYKIIAIIESKVERWFAEADVNTCIIILQKCKNEKERAENLVRFVYLKKPLRHFISAAEDSWENQLKRLQEIDKLKNTICSHDTFYENENFRIFPPSQKELLNEGLEEGKYLGAKWGKYLRAPKIFFKILEKGKDKLVPLKEVAQVRRGFTTGANEFFYLTEEEIKRWGIEKEFWMHKNEKGEWLPNYVIVSPKESRRVVIEAERLKKLVLFINRDRNALGKKNVLKYIKYGENKNLHKRPTCASRRNWYEIEIREPWPILFPMIHYDRQNVFANKFGCQVDHNLFEIKPKRKWNIVPLICFLLSTVSILFKEFGGRVNLGEGALKTEGIDVERLLVVKEFFKEPGKALRKLAKNYPNPEISSIFEDFHAYNLNEVSLDKVRPDRRELDKIIMGDILGLTEAEQLEVYRAVVDLVKSRIEKAKSVGNDKIKEGIDLGAMVKTLKGKIKEEN